MGNPVSAVFANIFMSYHEKRWLGLCPGNFKPILYKRYVDDTYVIFRSEAHVEAFFNYLNNQHCNIKFTLERESGRKNPIFRHDDNEVRWEIGFFYFSQRYFYWSRHKLSE